MRATCFQSDWESGGIIPDLDSFVRLPKRHDITDVGPIMVYQMAGLCVYISDCVRCCVGLVDSTGAMPIVDDRQCIWEFVFDLWTVFLWLGFYSSPIASPGGFQ